MAEKSKKWETENEIRNETQNFQGCFDIWCSPAPTYISCNFICSNIDQKRCGEFCNISYTTVCIVLVPNLWTYLSQRIKPLSSKTGTVCVGLIWKHNVDVLVSNCRKDHQCSNSSFSNFVTCFFFPAKIWIHSLRNIMTACMSASHGQTDEDLWQG